MKLPVSEITSQPNAENQIPVYGGGSYGWALARLAVSPPAKPHPRVGSTNKREVIQ